MNNKEIIIPLFEWNQLACNTGESKSKIEWLKLKKKEGYKIFIQDNSGEKKIIESILSK